MKKLIVLLLPLLIGCSESIPTAQQIVDRAIEFSGTSKLDKARASFVFRGIEYLYSEENGLFVYARIQKDSIGNEVKDVLTNDGLERRINDEVAEITEERRAAYTSSVNSVIYFAFLPGSLNDAAVNKSYVGIVEIKDKTYYKIKVTFSAEGGGEDYEDVFYYWFDTSDYSMDYLAYSYNEEDGVGLRFREAYNMRRVNDVVIQDYINYKPIDPNQDLSLIDNAFVNGNLKELSRIELEKMEITYL